jgi:hypothetical protein
LSDTKIKSNSFSLAMFRAVSLVTLPRLLPSSSISINSGKLILSL